MKVALSTAGLFSSLLAIAAPQTPQTGNGQIQGPSTSTGQPVSQVGDNQPQAPYTGPQPVPQTGTSSSSAAEQPQAPPLNEASQAVARSANIPFERRGTNSNGVLSVMASSILSTENRPTRKFRAARRQHALEHSRDSRSAKAFAASDSPASNQGTAASDNSVPYQDDAASSDSIYYQGSASSDGAGSYGCAMSAGSCSKE